MWPASLWSFWFTCMGGSGAGAAWVCGGAACRVQPQSALENAGGDADDAGRGRRDGSPALLRLAPARRGGIGTALALGRADLLGGRRRPFSWPLAAGPGRIRADRDSGCDLASGLSAGRIDFFAGFPLARQVPLAGLAANRGGDRWSAGPGDRLSRGTSLAHPDGPDAWLGSLDRARVR